MATLGWKNAKARRTCSEQASPRAGRQKRRTYFGQASPTSSSSSSSASPPRRRDAIKKYVQQVSSTVVGQHNVPEVKGEVPYRGVRYREELNKYVTEIRPAKSTKKIWLGTYDTPEEAARAFDIGNLCCKKNLPLNFPDSPRMLKKISSKLSPDEARNAIAKLAKEVAKMVIESTSDAETIKRKEVDRAAAKKAHDLVQRKAEDPFTHEAPFTQGASHLETAGVGSSDTYYEKPIEQVVAVDEGIATSGPLQVGDGGVSGGQYSFNLSEVFLDDDLAQIPIDQLVFFEHNVDCGFPTYNGHGEVIYYSI